MRGEKNKGTKQKKGPVRTKFLSTMAIPIGREKAEKHPKVLQVEMIDKRPG